MTSASRRSARSLVAGEDLVHGLGADGDDRPDLVATWSDKLACRHQATVTIAAINDWL
jgi:hypothetical protein